MSYKNIQKTVSKSFSQKSLITLVKENTRLKERNRWNWKHLTLNKNISKEDILSNLLFLPWDFSALSESDKMDIHFLNQIIERQRAGFLNWDKLSLNLNIKLTYIIKYSYYRWNWSLVSSREDLDIELVRKNPNLPWNWEKFSENNRITTDFVSEFKDKPWDYNALSKNTFLTMEKTYMKNDIKWRRTFCRDKLLQLYNDDLVYIIQKYIGYN